VSSVSCASSTACVAVGGFTDRAGDNLTLAERWDGKRWSIQPTPTPGPKNTTIWGDVSCASQNACTAVGWYGDSRGVSHALVERWDGTRWSVQRLRRLRGAVETSLSGVSCPTTTACTAVGWAQLRGQAPGVMVERWSGTN
jgi:hypothetical protein